MKILSAIGLLVGASVAAAVLSTGAAAAQPSPERREVERCSNSILPGTLDWAGFSSWRGPASRFAKHRDRRPTRCD